jgi:hypothetical protein
MGADKNSSPNRELGLYPKFTTKDSHTLLGIRPWPTPIYGCNMAVLVAPGISCIEVWWLTDGCNWKGAIAGGNHKMLCCNRFC